MTDMSTLIHRAHCVGNVEHISEELEKLRTVFAQNGYNKCDVEQTFRKFNNPTKIRADEEEDVI